MAFTATGWNAGTPRTARGAPSAAIYNADGADHTYETEDTLATVTAADYFNSVGDEFEVNDIIYVSGSDDVFLLRVTAITSAFAVTVAVLTRGEFFVDSFGAVGDRTTDDTPAIQAAIDAAYAVGGGVVRVPIPDDAYLLGSMLQMKANVTLAVDSLAELTMTVSDHMIRLVDYSHISGGYWNHTQSTNTDKSIFHIYAAGDSAIRFTYNGAASIKGCRMRSSSANADVAGIFFECAGEDTPTEAITWVTIDDVHITSCEWGIRFKCIESTAGSSWINGNTLSNIKMSVCKYGIHAEATITGSGVPAIAGNMVSNFQFQTHSISERAIYLGAGGYIRRWMFSNIMIWDWTNATGTYAIESLNNGGSAYYGHMFTNVPNLLSGEVDMGPGGFDVFQPALAAS